MKYPRYRFIVSFFIALVLAGFSAVVTRQTYAQPDVLACPRNQTITLRGDQAPPFQGLIVLFADLPVGGGFSDAAGRWQIPLRVNEPPGIYPVEVRLRDNQQLLARMVCYVDVPLPATVVPSPTEIPSPTPTSVPRPTTALPTVPPATRTTTPTGRATATPQITATTTPTVPTTETPRITFTPTPTSTLGGVPIATPTPIPAGISVTLEIVAYDRDTSTSLNEEYVILTSNEENDLAIGGWRLVNISRPERPTFVFPNFVLAPESEIYLYTGSGTNNLNTGDFYWGRSAPVWRKGDTAQLFDAQGRLVSSYQVP
ncbi:MAG: lamin tail domain-containing protein [Chloroflexus sp.]|nr:lamin tail domain-containing protein [Chloroflexus sp.]